MEQLSPNHKRSLSGSDILPTRMEMGDSSQIKSHLQEISSQTGFGPDMDRFLSDDLENNKDLLERSYPKDSSSYDRFQQTEVRSVDYLIRQNISDIQHLSDSENSSGKTVIGRRKPRSMQYSYHGGGSVSPPLLRRSLENYSFVGTRDYKTELASEDGRGPPPSIINFRLDNFEDDNNANPADLARPKPQIPKPEDIKDTNQETLSKKDNRTSSAQLDDANYTRASNVTLSNFVSVKLLGKSNYDMWKAQMQCLMKSHKMRGLVIKDKELPVNKKNNELWKQYETLLTGWLIGSLSQEIIKDKRIYNKRAKEIWDTLGQSYDPYPISLKNSTLLEPRDKKEKQGMGIERKLKKLHNATLEGRWWKAKSILNDHKDNGAATWKVNANGDTLLHVAVRLGNNYFLKELLDIIENEKEIDTLNSERHTALHIAAIVGNKEAAELLVEKNKELLSIQDKDKNIPLACAYLNKQVNVFVYLWGVTEKSVREGFRTENEEKEKEKEKAKAKENENENENENKSENDKDKKEEKENEKEKENEEGKENENEKEKEIEEGKENEIEKENENEKDERKEENEKEKGKEEGGKENEIKNQKGKQNKTEEVKQKGKEQRQQNFGQSLLNTVIYNKQYDLAKELVDINPHLAKQPSTLVVLTQNYPSQISFTETLMYPSLNDVCHKLVKRSFLPLDSLEYLYARTGGTLWKMRRFKNYSSLFSTLVISLLVPAAVLHLIYRLLCLLILLLRFPFSMLYFILWKVLSILVVPIKNIEKKKKEHKEAKKFLKWICSLNSLKDKNSEDSLFDKFYKESLMEAACLDVYEVLDQILKHSSNAMNVKNKDGHNIIQLAVINRSAKVYNLLSPIIERKAILQKSDGCFR